MFHHYQLKTTSGGQQTLSVRSSHGSTSSHGAAPAAQVSLTPTPAFSPAVLPRTFHAHSHELSLDEPISAGVCCQRDSFDAILITFSA